VESAAVIKIQPFTESSAESFPAELAAAADAKSECYSQTPPFAMSFAPSTEPQLPRVLMFHCWYRIMLFSKALQRQQVMAITSSLRPKQHSRRITVCLKKGKMEEMTLQIWKERGRPIWLEDRPH
jgi:hypothetical protein